MKRWLHVWIQGGVLVFVFLIVLLSPTASAAFKYLREGMTASVITGNDLLTNEPVATDSWLGQNTVIIVFWATWSARSLDELRDLKAFVDAELDLSVKIVAVNVDGQALTAQQKAQVVQLTRDLDLPFPVLLDDGLDVFYRYGVIAVPSTAVLDTSGVLRYAPSGYSLTTRDRIVDSVRVLRGLASASGEMALSEGYRPAKKAGRYCNLVLNQINRKQYERALSNLDLAEQADPGFAQPHLLRGEIYLAMDSLGLARASFTRAAELDSGSVAIWSARGVASLRSGRIEEAFEYLSRALQLDDTYTPAALNLGLCLAEQGKLDEALDSIQKARELNERDPLVLYYLGKVQLQSGDSSQTAESYRTALEILYPAP